MGRKAEKEARKAEKKALKAEKEAIKEKKGNEDHEEIMIQIDKNIKADSVTDNAPNKQDNNNIKEVTNKIENLNIEEKKQETASKPKTISKLENKTQQKS